MYRFKEWLSQNKEQHNSVKENIYELMQMAYNAGQSDADLKEYYDCSQDETIDKLQSDTERLTNALEIIKNTHFESHIMKSHIDTLIEIHEIADKAIRG